MAAVDESNLVEYRPGSAFPGVIGRTFDTSTQAWPEPLRAREAAPNVLFIILDDTGFGQLGCYGSPIRTPHLDGLAAGGLRYSNMHTTALCSPTRSCILTGRNHHSNGMAAITEVSTGYPGLRRLHPVRERVPVGDPAAAGLQHLRDRQVAPDAGRPGRPPPGPYDRWPLGRGFERYYGFLGGDTHQYYPELVYDNHQVEPREDARGGLPPDRGPGRQGHRVHRRRQAGGPEQAVLHVLLPPARCTPRTTCPRSGPTGTRASSTRAGTPTASGCSPARRSWDLSRPTPSCRATTPTCRTGTALSADERRLYARMMEVFAGFLEHTDHHIGRLLDFLEEIGELDNTLIMVISDNGASAEGGPHGSVNENKFFNNVPELARSRTSPPSTTSAARSTSTTTRGAGPGPATRRSGGGSGRPTAAASATRSSSTGRTASPPAARCARSTPTPSTWSRPCSTRSGSSRRPAIRGVTQAPIEGVSFAHTFDDADAPTRHVTQYFEMFGHRSIYHDGWRAVCPWPGTSFAESGRPFGTPIPADTLTELDATGWELYHVAEDFAENHNIADTRTGPKLIEMIAQWYVEAGKYNVLPIDGRGPQRFADPRPHIADGPHPLRLLPRHPGGVRRAAPRVLNRPHTITALVDIPEGGAEGVLVSPGRRRWRLHLLHPGRQAALRATTTSLTSASRSSATPTCPAGRHALSFEFEPTGQPDRCKGKGSPGIAKLFIDGTPVGQGDLPVTIPLTLGLASGVSVGADAGSPVTDEYPAPFALHRHHRRGRLRRLRRAHRRPRGRDPPSPRPPIDDRASMATRTDADSSLRSRAGDACSDTSLPRAGCPDQR